MVHDPIVAQAIQHTLIYTAMFVPGTMIVGLFLAVAMNRKIRFISFYRTAAYATMAISTISEAIVFIWLFDPSYGIVNYAFSKVGLPQQQFLNSPSEALYVIAVMTIWGWTGFAVVVYLAALQGVPQTLLEAAAIDGCGPVADVPQGHAAVAQPGLAVPRGLAHHQRAAAVRRGVPQYPGRPAQRDHRPRLLPVRAGLPEFQLRLRVRHRLLPVPHHHRDHRHPVLGWAGGSRTTGHERDLRARARRRAAGRPAVASLLPGAGGGCRSVPGTWC